MSCLNYQAVIFCLFFVLTKIITLTMFLNTPTYLLYQKDDGLVLELICEGDAVQSKRKDNTENM